MSVNCRTSQKPKMDLIIVPPPIMLSCPLASEEARFLAIMPAPASPKPTCGVGEPRGVGVGEGEAQGGAAGPQGVAHAEAHLRCG